MSGTRQRGPPLSGMRRLASLLMTVLNGGALTTQATAADPLSAHRWRDRVLVVLAPDAGDARLASQRRVIRDARRGMGDRDLVIVEAVGESTSAKTLRRRFRLGREAFAAILVGKDGGEKLRSASALQADQLFETIDAMPMRRDEMRRRSSDAR